MSPAYWQLVALNTAHANLHRLHVYETASALVEDRPAAAGWVEPVRRWVDRIGDALQGSLERRAVTEEEAAAVQRLAPWLAEAVRRYYGSVDLDGPPRTRAAFGAAHVAYTDHQQEGERAIAQAFGDDAEHDRLLQIVPQIRTLVEQADAAVASAAEGDPSDEALGFIAEHVRVAVDDRDRMLLQVDAVPLMVTGMDPREVDEAWRVLG